MFDFSLAEIALVVVVSVVFIGPKELPVVIRTVSKAMRSGRAMVRELQAAFDDLSRESGLKETAEEFHREVQMIKGDDGKMYERYDLPSVMTSTKVPEIAKPEETPHHDQ